MLLRVRNCKPAISVLLLASLSAVGAFAPGLCPPRVASASGLERSVQPGCESMKLRPRHGLHRFGARGPTLRMAGDEGDFDAEGAVDLIMDDLKKGLARFAFVRELPQETVVEVQVSRVCHCHSSATARQPLPGLGVANTPHPA